MKKVLIFVISVRTPPYDSLLDASLETWDAQPLEHTETIYYCGRCPQKPHQRIIYLNCNESYNGMSDKDVMAFDWALKNKQWDYMARVNSSCYVRKLKLVDAVQHLPNTGVFRGVSAGTFMWGGAQFILSRDVVEKMIANRHKCQTVLMDDIFLSQWARDIDVQWDTKGNACSINRTANGWSCIWYRGRKAGRISIYRFSRHEKARRSVLYSCQTGFETA